MFSSTSSEKKRSQGGPQSKIRASRYEFVSHTMVDILANSSDSIFHVQTLQKPKNRSTQYKFYLGISLPARSTAQSTNLRKNPITELLQLRLQKSLGQSNPATLIDENRSHFLANPSIILARRPGVLHKPP